METPFSYVLIKEKGHDALPSKFEDLKSRIATLMQENEGLRGEIIALKKELIRTSIHKLHNEEGHVKKTILKNNSNDYCQAVEWGYICK